MRDDEYVCVYAFAYCYWNLEITREGDRGKERKERQYVIENTDTRYVFWLSERFMYCMSVFSLKIN